MSNLAKRMCVAIASLAVAGGAVLGAGGTASAATPLSGHVKSPPVSVVIGDHHRSGADDRDAVRGDDRRFGRGHDDCGTLGHDHRRDGGHDHRGDRRDDCRWDHGVSYLWDSSHGWRHDGDRHGGDRDQTGHYEYNRYRVGL
ncbi:hypothetical protein AB0L67_38470 [Streptomyces flaveolus]|uniref:hypothetical protein n=1 Tax=Streptomyces flaveolus TaxID=67297 RepID=UPI0034166722